MAFGSYRYGSWVFMGEKSNITGLEVKENILIRINRLTEKKNAPLYAST